MIRRGFFCKYNGKIYKCTTRKSSALLRSNDVEDFEQRGFEKNPYYDEEAIRKLEKYLKEVPKEEIEWFCKICTKGKYKGEDVNIDGEENGKYLISSNLILAKDRGVFNEEHGFKDVMDGGYGTYVYAGYVDKSEVTDVKEVKTPINEYLKAPDNWDF